MTEFTEINGVLHAELIPLDGIAETSGTPAYIYSENQIRKNVDFMQAAFKNGTPLIAYACKANGNLAILRLMSSLGLGADIVSAEELQRCIKAGIPANKIVFSGVGKTREEIEFALNNNILQLNVESKSELELIADIAEENNITAPVSLRYNPDVDARTHEKITTGRNDNKFGIEQNEVERLYEWAAQNKHLDIRGLSIHIGSQLTTLEPFEIAFKKIAALVRKLRDKGFPLLSIDLGGGIGIPYNNEETIDLASFTKLIDEIIAPLDVEIILEPGRYLVGNTGILLSRVTYIKETSNRNYLILDAGMNDLLRPSLYGAYHSIVPVKKSDGPLRKYDVVGPVCESSDIFVKDLELAEMQQGDLVAIMTCGAYGAVMASNYNAHLMAPEILVNQDKFTIIRQKQNIQDIMNREIIPDWL